MLANRFFASYVIENKFHYTKQKRLARFEARASKRASTRQNGPQRAKPTSRAKQTSTGQNQLQSGKTGLKGQNLPQRGKTGKTCLNGAKRASTGKTDLAGKTDLNGAKPTSTGKTASTGQNWPQRGKTDLTGKTVLNRAKQTSMGKTGLKVAKLTSTGNFVTFVSENKKYHPSPQY